MAYGRCVFERYWGELADIFQDVEVRAIAEAEGMVCARKWFKYASEVSAFLTVKLGSPMISVDSIPAFAIPSLLADDGVTTKVVFDPHMTWGVGFLVSLKTVVPACPSRIPWICSVPVY